MLVYFRSTHNLSFLSIDKLIESNEVNVIYCLYIFFVFMYSLYFPAVLGAWIEFGYLYST